MSNALEQGVCIHLRRIVEVRRIKQVLNAEDDLCEESVIARVAQLERGRTCFRVMAGFQPFSSFKMDRQIVPEG